MNKLLLKLVMLPAALWRSLGADTDQLRAILTLRLTIDDRRPMSLGRRSARKRNIKNGTLINSFLFLMMGCFYMLLLTVVKERITSLAIYFSLFFLMLTLTLITDFSNTLFDNRDKYILFPRPINDTTLVLSKLLHVFIYLLRMVLPMALPGWILLAVKDGWASALLFPLPLLLLVAMVLFLVNSFYLLVLRLARPEKFKDVINYFQIITSIVFFATFYLLPTVFRDRSFRGFSISAYIWMQYLPSAWLASCWTWIGFPASFGGSFALSLAGVAVPVVCVYVLIKWLSPEFSKRISGIDGQEVSLPQLQGRPGARGGKLYIKMANVFNFSSEAKAGFMIAWLQTSRSRTFRMRVYPSLAFIPIYFIYLLSRDGRSLTYAFTHLAESRKFLLLLYMSSYALIMGMNYLVMSDQYKAAWVYYSAPLSIPGKVMIGALKAMWVKLFLPFFTIICIFVVCVWGAAVIPDIILALVNVTLLAVAMALISFRQLPFSNAELLKQKGSRVIKSLFTMIIPFALGLGHYASLSIWWLKLLFLILSSIALWMVWDSYANTDWARIAKEDTGS